MSDKTYSERVNECLSKHGSVLSVITAMQGIASEADAELAACRLRIAELETARDALIAKVREELPALLSQSFLEGVDSVLKLAEKTGIAAIDAALNTKKESE